MFLLLQVELSCTRNKMAEARVANTEGKLADYNQKLNKRTEKLNELHIKLKLRKDKMLEREERLRQFEKGNDYTGTKPHTFFIKAITFVKTLHIGQFDVPYVKWCSYLW